ncbi:MAG: hypothetical protein IJ365_00540 [Clostridia bacterium]|nr:hypothetical protein [Clostridia bacterium]
MDTRLQDNLNSVQHNYIAPFLWLHNEDDELIVNEIQRIYECGIRSVCLESRTHEEFCREDWWSDIRLTFDECKKRDMNVWILDDKHFPTGYANGIFEKEENKHLRPFGITEWHVDVAGPVKDGSVIVDRHAPAPEDEIVAVAAIKHIPGSDDYSEIIDITDGLSDGMVYFDLPEGMWRIVIMIKTRRGRAERHSPFMDMLNPVCTDMFIEEVYEAHYERFAEYFGNTFLGFFSDEPSFLNNSANPALVYSPEMGTPFMHYPWSDELRAGVADNVGEYAGLWYDINGVSDKIRYSYMNTITRMYQNNFSDKLGQWCSDHGVMYIGHIIEDNNSHARTGNGPGHYFRALEGQHMSGIDVVLQQIVPGLTECSNIGCVSYRHMNNEFFHYYLGKLGSSLAHIDPKKQGRAMCEIFGAYGWAEGTKMMKYLMDHMLVRGINYFVPHAFSPKPNDTDCPPNFYDSGNNPQYRYFKNNMDYMNRMCHMLSGGTHVSTCAILYDAESRWINGDFTPLEKIAKKLYDNLYDYDIVPADYLDKINTGAEKYNLLIVPYSLSIDEEIVHKLNSAGIDTIVVYEKSCGQYNLPCTHTSLDKLVDFIAAKGLCDVASDYDGIYLRYYHYTRDNAHIYMFSNEDINNTINTKITMSAFRGGRYIEYDAFNNKAYTKTSSGEVELCIPPYHSVLIICGDTVYDGIPEYTAVKYTDIRSLTPEFTVSTAERNSEKFTLYKTTDKLFNITGRGELPRFSGRIKYEAEITLDKTDCTIDLGFVGEVAELYLNGKHIGTRQIPPYRFDISADDIGDKNMLTVVVANHNGYAVRDGFSSFLLFEPSGLLGPVTVHYKGRKP